MHIRMFTNDVAGGWLATDLDDFLGGSEEGVVLLSEALVRKGYKVSVYHSTPAGENTAYEKDGVEYTSRESVVVNKGDALITFKDKLPWLGKEQDASVKIHWSAEVERPWDCTGLDYFVNMTRYHNFQNLFVPDHINKIVPHGVDKKSLMSVGAEYETSSNEMLYCSSPDRGLLNLLIDWAEIKSHHPELKLRITYGFKNLRLMGDPALEKQLVALCKQDDVELLGQLSTEEMNKEYHRAEWWVLPLNVPTSELFCLNAVKAQLCGCKPVINRIGALRDTVGDYVPYSDFVKGLTACADGNKDLRIYSWDKVVKNYWIPMLEKQI